MVPHAPLWPIWSRLNSGLVLPSFGVSTSDLPGDVVWCFPQVMTNLAPFFFLKLNLFTYQLLFSSLPKLLIVNFVRPQMLKMRLRQLFMKVWLFWSASLVSLHVSDPLRRNVFEHV